MIIIYFSGTGNTKFLVKNFGKMMNCQSYSIEEHVDFKKLISQNKTICLCYPIHCSLAPIIFRKFIKNLSEEFKGKKLIIFCSQQFFSGDGARSITDLLEDIDVIYAQHFNMPNNITSLPLFYNLTKMDKKKSLYKTYIKLI